METVRGCDLAVLVSEPTLFGLHDLMTVISSLKVVGVPMILVINKEGSGTEDLEKHAMMEGVQTAARIPFDRRMAEVYSRGGDLLEEVEGFREAMVRLKDAIQNMTRGKHP
jgi:MinD superfamily P-loop ATPase